MPIFRDYVYSEKDDYIVIRSYCGEEVDITVPSTIKGKPVTEITRMAFAAEEDVYENTHLQHCKNRIYSIQLPQTILKMEGVFEDCEALREIFIPDDVELIGNRNFFICKNLEKIHVSESNKRYSTRNGILYSKDGKTLICCPANYMFLENNYLEGVEIISSNAFNFCNNLINIEIPNNVKIIQDGAFSNCRNLEEVQLHPELVMEGNGHFWCCKKLRSIGYCNKEETIPCSEFSGCCSLVNISFNSKIRNIEMGAFSNTGLTSFCAPTGLVAIKRNAFLHCWDLQDVFMPKSVSRIHDTAFTGCGSNLQKKEDTNISNYFGLKPNTTFHVIEGSKADKFCVLHGYKVEYI